MANIAPDIYRNWNSGGRGILRMRGHRGQHSHTVEGRGTRLPHSFGRRFHGYKIRVE